MNRQIFIAITLATTLFLGGAVSASDVVDKYQNGIAAYDAGRYEEAIKKFNDLLKSDLLNDHPNAHSTVFVRLAMSHYRLKQFPAAIANATKAIDLTPDDAFTFHFRGVIHGSNKNWDKAIDDFDEAIRLAPDHVAYYRARALGYQGKSEHKKAIPDLLVYLEERPDHASTLRLLAYSYLFSGEFTLATDQYEKIINLDIEIPGDYLGRGVSSLMRGNFSGALNDFVEAIHRGVLIDIVRKHFEDGIENHPIGEFLRK